LRRPPFRRQRHQRRGVAQGRPEIGAAQIKLWLRRYGVERRKIDVIGARLVANHRQRGRNLRFCDWGCHVRNLDVGDVTPITDWRGTIARQHVKRIGQFTAAILAGLRSGRDIVAQTINGKGVRGCGHLEPALARAGQEIRHIGIEPGILAADRPQAERPI
jgi:hypothetical protein